MAHRGGSLFISDWRQHSRPLDRNEVARIVFLAERLELNSKAPGKRNGLLGQIGLQVLRALLWRFHNRRTGLCCPSYDAIRRVTGLCRQSIANALERLEAAGILRRQRRLRRQLQRGIVTTTNDTSLYSLWCPKSTLQWVTATQVAISSFPKRNGTRKQGFSRGWTDVRAALLQSG
jgi:helix-turn-helix protein